MFRSFLRSARGVNFRRFSAEAEAEPAKKQSYFQSDAWIKTVGSVGAMANWTIPLAGIAHMRSGKEASTIDPYMTANLMVYSVLFMRWSLAIGPPNPLLFLCHFSNECIQITQMARYLLAKK